MDTMTTGSTEFFHSPALPKTGFQNSRRPWFVTGIRPGSERIRFRKSLAGLIWKQTIWAVLIVLISACAAMASPKKVFLSDGDAGSLVKLDASTVAVIEMWSNPSTGYSWRARKPLGKHIRIVGTEFDSSQPGLKGAWGKEKIYVVGVSKGRSILALQYRRALRGKKAAAVDTVRFDFNTTAGFKESFSLESKAAAVPPPDTMADTLAALPSSFNWCDQNGCTPVKDQGQCGSCWAFATVGPLESLIKINDGVTVDLSEQYLVSCNSENWGCTGGDWAHDYHQWKTASGESEPGAVLESDFPYKSRDAACQPPHDKAYQIADWDYVCGSRFCQPTTSQLKQAIQDYGPLTVAVCANQAFQDYNGGVFSGPSCGGLNHGVILVGWDDSDGCWIMRNSWGPNWGESGYMRIKYGVSGIGSEATYVVYGGSPTPGPNPDPEPEPDGNELTNGETVSNLAAATDEWLYYFIDVPEGADSLQVRISSGSGDADLYTRYGSQPTASEYDCRPYRWGNYETCSESSPQAGRWYIGVHGYRSFSGVNVIASY